MVNDDTVSLFRLGPRERPIEKRSEIAAFVTHGLAQNVQFTLSGTKPVSEMEACENCRSSGIQITCATRNRRHQLVNLLGQRLGITSVTRR